MKKSAALTALFALLLVIGASNAFAAGPNGPRSGDCDNPIMNVYNWLRDADGDGIPNCEDEDWVPPQDGSGYGKIGSGPNGAPPAEDPGANKWKGDNAKEGVGDRDRDRTRLQTCK